MKHFLMNWLTAACWGALTVTAAPTAPPDRDTFGKTPEGTPVQIYTLTNAHGCEARITNYGGIIVSLKIPDRNGKSDDVVLGFDRAEDYAAPAYHRGCPYFGAMIGRVANRIAGGTFTLGGHEYHVSTNEGANTLHGGKIGFDQRLWEEVSSSSDRLVLRYVSPDGEEGFPGTLTTTITYTLTDANALDLHMEATTDKETVVNLTNHTYWNLKGSGQGDILGHELTVHGKEYVPMDAKSLPVGGVRPVEGTPLDFTRPTAIGARLDGDHGQLRHGMGYDLCYVVDGYAPDTTAPRLMARVTEPTTGRVLEVASTQPGVQFYTGNQLNGSVVGKGGVPYQKRGGFCLEPQHYPDSPNHPEFPSTVLRPGETYRQTISFRFSVVP